MATWDKDGRQRGPLSFEQKEMLAKGILELEILRQRAENGSEEARRELASRKADLETDTQALLADFENADGIQKRKAAANLAQTYEKYGELEKADTWWKKAGYDFAADIKADQRQFTQAADFSIKNGDTERAKNYYRLAAQNYEATNENDLAAECWMRAGEEYQERASRNFITVAESYEESKDFDSAVDAYKKSGKMDAMSACSIRAAEHFEEQHDYSRAAEFWKTSGRVEEIASAFVRGALYFEEAEDYSSAVTYWKQAAEQGRKDNNEDLVIASNIHTADCYDCMNPSHDDIELTTSAAALRRDIGDKRIAIYYEEQRNYSRAAEFWDKAGNGPYAAECREKAEIKRIEDEQAAAHKAELLGRFEDAIEHWRNAGRNDELVPCWTRAAEYYEEQQDFETAIEYWNKALKSGEAEKCYGRAAEACEQKHDYEGALAYWKKSRNPEKEAECIEKAELYKKAKAHEAAERFQANQNYKEAIEQWKIAENNERLLECYANAATYCQVNQQYEQAAEYWENALNPAEADKCRKIIAEQKRKEEAARLAEERRIAELKRQEEEARLAEERRISEMKAAEAARIAAEKARIEEQRRKAEEARLAEERRIDEQKRRAEEERLAEQQRMKAQAIAAQQEQQRRIAQARAAEQAQRAEQQRQAVARAAASRQTVAGARQMPAASGKSGGSKVWIIAIAAAVLIAIVAFFMMRGKKSPPRPVPQPAKVSQTPTQPAPPASAHEEWVHVNTRQNAYGISNEAFVSPGSRNGNTVTVKEQINGGVKDGWHVVYDMEADCNDGTIHFVTDIKWFDPSGNYKYSLKPSNTNWYKATGQKDPAVWNYICRG